MAPSSTVAPLSGPLPTAFTTIDKTVTDPSLGHEIVVRQLARALPWPVLAAGATGQSAAFELMAVQMTWTPGKTYTAPLRAIDFSLITGSQYPNRPDPLINAQLVAAGWELMPAEVLSGESVTGWLIFKVDPKAATSVRLDYTRPAIVVTGTKKSFPKQVFNVQIVG